MPANNPGFDALSGWFIAVNFFYAFIAPCPILVIRESQLSSDLALLGLRCKRGAILLSEKVD